ncbi:hypothetical protein E1B28_002204 [Marasmius oreades]|uniref:Lysine-specific metallo-endopeptidase domain-containing protein n=1 Tax=Marasmius oreades TaxID=181124 RepID=A0A9P7RNN3_9AGAR|nr:uncharacterized protein E1B28_002204 [Marasmius oreades]KAG7086233.1 hypothetical protein E1B28_002204 [Marasmius oreades]
MFSKLTFALLSAFVQLGLALNQGDLTVSLQAIESSVKSVGDIILTAVISNPTENDVRVLRAHNVLDTSATQSFDITSSDGTMVPFAGIKPTIDLSNESAYVIIPAGQSVAVNHSIGSFYDFSSFATGTSFSFAPRTTFQLGYDDTPIVADAAPVEVKVNEDLSFTPFFASPGASLSTPTCSDGGKLGVITDSLRYARSLAGGAATDITSSAPNGPHFQTYFGGNSNSDIWYNLDRIAGDLVGNRGIYCAIDYADSRDGCNNNPSWIAYTVINGADNPIYVCELFFQAGSTPNICNTHTYDDTMSSNGGIILHELSHAVDGTDDVIYGCSASATLSPADKKRNADNYRCLGLNVYLDWNCIHGPL